MKKVVSSILNVILVLFIVFAVIVTVAVVSSTFNDSRLPNINGYALLSVQSDSMDGKPEIYAAGGELEGKSGFAEGDLLVIKLLDLEEAKELKVGDVITYIVKAQDKTILDTHRIVANTKEKGTVYENFITDGILKKGDSTYYVTKGDNVTGADENYITDMGVIGKWEGTSVAGLGNVMDFLQSQVGFFVCIVLPLLAFFIFQMYSFVKTFNAKKHAETLAEVSATEEAIKQKAVEEFLAKQQSDASVKADASAEQAQSVPAASESNTPE